MYKVLAVSLYALLYTLVDDSECPWIVLWMSTQYYYNIGSVASISETIYILVHFIFVLIHFQAEIL